MINGRVTRASTDIDENTDMRVDKRAESLEKPTMRVDLLLVLFLQAEQDLARGNALVSSLKFHLWVD